MNTPNPDRRLERCSVFLRSLTMTLVAIYCGIVPTAASDLEMTGFRLVQGEGHKQWEIRSASARYDGENRVLLGGIDARVVNGNGGFAVTGRKGEYRSDLEILTIDEDVQARTGSGYSFSAPTVRWLGKEAQVQATGGVDLKAAGVDVKGKRMVYDVYNKIAVLKGRVLALWTIDREAP